MTPELTQEQTNFPANGGDTPERLSPGALIRRARERARMTPEELAAQTKLARSTLEALERDDFNTLIEPVYVRGYYRKCAKVLDLSEKELLDAYEARVAPRTPVLPAKLRLASGSELGTGGRLPISLAAIGAVGAVILCALIYLARGEQNNSVPPAVSAKADAMVPNSTQHAAPAATMLAPSEMEPAASLPLTEIPAVGGAATAAPTFAQPNARASAEVVTPAPVPTAPARTTSPSPSAMSETAHSNPVPLVAAQSLSSKPAFASPDKRVSVTPATNDATHAPATAANTTMTLNFSITSWARVDDANSKVLLNGLMRTGDKQVLTGTAPFKVFLGNAPGVKLEINGKHVDLTKYTAANNTARLSIGGNTP
jgi:cytoskeleton protein RodZ